MSALRSMAAALGGDVVKGRDGVYILCPGPGHSAKDRSLSVTPSRTDPDGFICFSHANDTWQDCRRHVLACTGGKASEYRKSRRVSQARATSADDSASAIKRWNEGVNPCGTLAERYLNDSRRLELPDDLADRVVRFHGACPWRGEDGSVARRPCMLTAFRSIAGDKLVAVHRTLLSDDGQKLDRRMLGPVAGAAIKIDADADVEYGLAICEGFETGLAGRALGFRPVWAVGSADAIAKFPVMAGVDALTILAETDDSGANAKAVRSCGNRWAAADREIIIATPRAGGDMNDAWRSQ
jgi:putative DNA primase/helicase